MNTPPKNTPYPTAENADTLLHRTPLRSTDAARIVLEMLEELGPITRSVKSRDALLRLLRRVVLAGVPVVRKAEQTVTFAQAVQESLESRAGRRPLTLRDLRHFTNRMLKVEGMAERPIRSIGVAECRTLLGQAFGSSSHSYCKGRTILHSIFAYAMRREWCDRNPVDCIERPRVRERPIIPLSTDEIARLEKAVQTPQHRDMQLSLHLMLYCGVRPHEVRRLDPARDIDWGHRQVLIRPNTSKTGGGRIIPLRKARLVRRECRQVIPLDWSARWRSLRQTAGFLQWQADVCRHTFASYHAQRFRNLPQLQLEMGHSDTNLLRTRYVMAQLGNAARRFWK